MPKFVELDAHVTLAQQLADEGGPVILINRFSVAPEEADALLAAWAQDAAFMKAQPGFISTQLHRGIAGSTAFLNEAVWQDAAHFRAAFGQKAFRDALANYPASTVATPHLFRKVSVPGICVA
jgi:heme-degrading monooxygenase HmoA